MHATAFDALPIQVWTARPDGTLDYVNPAVTDYFCVTAASVLAHGWKNLCHPHDLIEAVQRWASALQTGEPVPRPTVTPRSRSSGTGQRPLPSRRSACGQAMTEMPVRSAT